MTPDDLETVRRSIPFANLPESLQDRLLEQAQLQILRPDDVAFVQDELPEALFIVLEGWMKLCRTGSSGPETVISTVSSGGSLGEASVLQGVPSLVTTKAITPARLLRMEAADLRKMMKKEPAIAASMLNAALDQLQQLVLQIEDLKARSGVQRLALFLLGRLEDSKDQREVALPYSKALLAGQLGMEPETLSRAFARLRAHGVRVEATAVHVEDCALLHRLSLEEQRRSRTS